MKHLKIYESDFLNDFTKDLFGLGVTIYVSFITSSIEVSHIIMEQLIEILTPLGECRVKKEGSNYFGCDYTIKIDGNITYDDITSLLKNPKKEDLQADYDTVTLDLIPTDINLISRKFKIGWTKKSGIFRFS